MTPDRGFALGRRPRRRWLARWALALWTIAPLLAPVPAFPETPTIPGTDASIEVLPAAVEWDFDLQNDTDPAHLTLTSSGGGPAADRAVTYRFRSTDPYSGEPGNRTYLRFALTVFQFSAENEARAAFDTTFAPLDSSEFSSLCFAGGYWLLVGHRVYRLDVPCLFSRDNYEKLVRALRDALDMADESAWRAVQCHCGGSFDLSG